MSRSTDAGGPTVPVMCTLLGLSRQVYDATRSAPAELAPARRTGGPRGVTPSELGTGLGSVLAEHPAEGPPTGVGHATPEGCRQAVDHLPASRFPADPMADFTHDESCDCLDVLPGQPSSVTTLDVPFGTHGALGACTWWR